MFILVVPTLVNRFFADRFPAEFTMTRQALLLTRSTVLPFFYGCYLQHWTTVKVDPHCASNYSVSRGSVGHLSYTSCVVLTGIFCAPPLGHTAVR